jgi:formamidopyrimidine-DNA glycosylase
VPELPDITGSIEALEARIRGVTLERTEIRNPFLLRTVEPPIAHCIGHRVT